MAKIERFEDMEVWQQARKIVKKIYSITCQGKFSRDFGLREQIQLYIALDLGYIEKDTFNSLNADLISISSQISGFIQYLKSSEMRGQKR